MSESHQSHATGFLIRHRRATMWFLAVVMYVAASFRLLGPSAFDYRPPGTGLERPAAYQQAVLTDRDVLMAFTIGYAPNPAPYAPVRPTSGRGWGKIALADLAWYGPDDPPARAKNVPSFADNMEEFARETAGRPMLPTLDMPLFMSEAEDRRFLVDAAARHGTCLVRFGDRDVFLVRAPDAPGEAPQFTRMQAPERPYKRWWSDAVYVATYPARLLLVVGFVLMVVLFGMH